jgi:SAM-dependent methyltransferase
MTMEQVADPPALKPALRIIGVATSHDTLRRVLANRPAASILDVPAGEGVFCAFLRERNWQVHAADIDPGNFKLDGVPFTQVNLNEPLPFADASFDAVSCINGLHRLLFPDVAIGEFFRILRPGGHLYLNVNNYSSMWKRLRFLFTGSIDDEIDNQSCLQTIDDREAHVRLPLMYPRLARILADKGFAVADVRPASVRSRDRVVAPLAWAVSAASALKGGGSGGRVGNHRAVVAGGAYLFIEAVKPAKPAPAAG